MLLIGEPVARAGLIGRVAAVAAVLAAALVMVLTRSGEREPGPPPKVFAFVSGLGGAELRRLERVGRRIDVIAPNWYGLDTAAGSLQGPRDPGPLLAAARRQGVAVWPAVNARTGGSRAWEAPEARTRIVRSLVAAAEAPGASGVTLDMEELLPVQRDAFSALVREAVGRLHAVGRQLAVYVPRPGPGPGSAYDWSALAATADLLLCSGYNEHWAGGSPGPTTTSGGFQAVLDRARGLDDARKAVPVLGAFGYRWPPAAGGELISSADAERLRRRMGGATLRSDGSERFRSGGDTVVYETAAGLRARAAAARAAGTTWIGLFSLGREPAAFWRGFETSRTARSAT